MVVSKFGSLLTGAFVLAAISCAPAARAQAGDTPTWIGTVDEIRGPENSLVVLRGSEAYALYPDDLLFLGDKVFTRSAGYARLMMDGCKIDLEPASYIEITERSCEQVITQLEADSSLAGIPVLVAAAPQLETGASLALTPLLAAGGAAAAGASALGTSNSAAAVE
jgi:hypothetical protein